MRHVPWRAALRKVQFSLLMRATVPPAYRTITPPSGMSAAADPALHPQRLVGELRFSLKSEHGRRHFHLTQVDLDVCVSFVRSVLKMRRSSILWSAYNSWFAPDCNRPCAWPGHFGDEIGFSLMQIYRAGMDLEESDAGFDGFQQRAGEVSISE